LLKNGLGKTQRLIRHIIRVGFSMLWAALAFTDKVVKILGGSIEGISYIVILPALIILFITLYWILRCLSFY